MIKALKRGTEPRRDDKRKRRKSGSRRSIKTRIMILLLVPLISLISLWGYALTYTVKDTLYVNLVAKIEASLHMQTGMLFDSLQEERRASMVYLGSGRSTQARQALDTRRQETDRQIADFRKFVVDQDVLSQVNPDEQGWLKQTQSRLAGMADIRKGITDGTVSRAGAEESITGVIQACMGVFTMMTTDINPNYGFYHKTMVAFERSREALSQEDSLLAGTLATGTMTLAERDTLVERIGARQALLNTAQAGITDHGIRDQYQQFIGSEGYKNLGVLETELLQGGTESRRAQQTFPFSADAWNTTRTTVMNQLEKLEKADYDVLYAHAVPVVTWILVNMAAMLLVGVIIVIVSILLTLRIGRTLIRQLIDLKETLLELAEKRLPKVMDRLRRGEKVDVVTEAPTVSFGSDEIGQVGHAFNIVQQAAVHSAVEQAELEAGVRQVFISLAGRSQALLHRQLALLDSMERRVDNPDELERLFQLDHLATRMRRHAEALTILAGSKAGRRWSRPIPLVDVIRGAVEEVENYVRVKIAPVPGVALLGHVAADVTHLLAELIENALAYSPPHTQVMVSGERVPKGFVIEIEDRGLGIASEELGPINDRLENPPEFQVSDDHALLGLYVVGQLAKRHHIHVHLRHSPYGGITAIVLVPDTLMVSEDQDEGGPAIGAGAAGSEDPGPPTRQRPSEATPAGPANPYAAGARTDRNHPNGSHSDRSHPVRAGEDPTGVRMARSSQRAEMDLGRLDDLGAAIDPVSGRWRPRPRRTVSDEYDEHDEHPEPAPVSTPVVVAKRPDAVSGHTRTGLPRRVRQASLAPELQNSSPKIGTTREDGVTVRSPEETRAIVTAIQEGTQQGRADAERLDQGIDRAPGYGRGEER